MSLEVRFFDATALTHNLPRINEHCLNAVFVDAVFVKTAQAGLCNDDRFSVNGSLIESDASINMIRPKDEYLRNSDGDSNSFKSRNAEVYFYEQSRTNDAHASWTVPEARLQPCVRPASASLTTTSTENTPSSDTRNLTSSNASIDFL